MGELGYNRFGAQGGDIGAGVSMWLARNHGPHLIAAHLNYIPGSFRPPLEVGQSVMSQEEQDFQNRSSQQRSWGERVFDVQRWEPMARGGHFAALEQPEILADEIRQFFRPLRSQVIATASHRAIARTSRVDFTRRTVFAW
jgi:hypothetical protein